jgi:long-chain acyl-CoA synthetase
MKPAEFLASAAKRFPQRVAVYNSQGQLTYSELYDEVKKLSAILIQHGLLPQSGVGVMGNNSREFIIASMAVFECGAVLFPISHQTGSHEMEQILHAVPLSMILHSPECNGSFSGSVSIQVANGLWGLNKMDNPLIPVVPHVPDAAFIRFTSGTTGTSKGVVLSSNTLSERTEAANQSIQLTHHDIIMCVLPMAYHYVVSILLYIRNGCGIIIGDDFTASSLISTINRYGATLLYASPMHIRLLSQDTGESMMPSLTKVISTTTGIAPEQCDAFKRRFGLPVYQAYGIIEVGLPIMGDGTRSDALGLPAVGYEVAIMNEEGIPLNKNETGNLYVRGPGMLDAYLHPPKLRNEILSNGYFFTGDLAQVDDDGYIILKGRRKSMINVAGNKVFPEEVENILNLFPGISSSRVSGASHPLLGECVQAEIVLVENTTAPDPEDIRKFCRGKLSSFKIPQKIVFTSLIPMTDSGKIKRG